MKQDQAETGSGIAAECTYIRMDGWTERMRREERESEIEGGDGGEEMEVLDSDVKRAVTTTVLMRREREKWRRRRD